VDQELLVHIKWQEPHYVVKVIQVEQDHIIVQEPQQVEEVLVVAVELAVLVMQVHVVDLVEQEKLRV
tara:strand:- start:104 stop:304 length:201 start_codon:yes stop_codon:yes gene_type:complete